MPKPKIVILSGAGVSAESGLATFRGSDGLWEGHRVEDVATPQGFRQNPTLVLEFYNQRRRQAKNALPNTAHLAIKDLEKDFDLVVITQNVDNLHEKAGSTKVMHLHGELFKTRSTKNENSVFELNGTELILGDLAPDGSQLRPHIVWFGEAVPMMDSAIDQVASADAMVVIGTSLQVYPAASLVDFLPKGSLLFVVDPFTPSLSGRKKQVVIQKVATEGMVEVMHLLKEKFSKN